MTAKPKKKPSSFSRRLKRIGACSEAVEWIGKRSLAAAWRECERADWMLWLLSRATGWSRDALNRCNLDLMADALESARTQCSKEAYWPIVEAAHKQVREAIIAGVGLDAAASAARSAAWSAARSAASAARSAAAWSAAWSAARSVESVASVDISAQSRLADIVRKHFPKPPKIGATK